MKAFAYLLPNNKQLLSTFQSGKKWTKTRRLVIAPIKLSDQISYMLLLVFIRVYAIQQGAEVLWAQRKIQALKEKAY